MKIKYLLFSILINMALVSCSKKDSEQPTPSSTPASVTKKPGYFQFSILNPAVRLHAGTDSVYDFDLGDVRASKSYYFLLTNGGDFDITNIQIKSSHPNFNVFPNKISVLKGKLQGLNQLIALDLVHGRAINGSNLSALLPMNENAATVTITGTTTDNSGKSIALKSIARYKAMAKVMDVTILANNTPINLDSVGLVSTIYGGLGFARYYLLGNIPNFALQNTGNVSVKIKYGKSAQKPLKDSVYINPGEKKEFTFDTQVVSSTFFFELDGNNTITDDRKIQLGNNNKGYFMIVNKFY